jgi:hypothetical protein
MGNMRFVFFVGILCSFVGVTLAADQRPVPDEPAERFTVLVFSNQADDPDVKYPLSKVTKEVAKRIKKQKKWFLVSDNPDKAEIRIEVVNHSVSHRMRVSMEYRMDPSGTGKHLVDVSTMEELHFIEGRVNLPGGTQVLVKGADERVKNGSLKRAAENFADNLEDLCRARYWELAEARITAPAEQE